MPPRCADADGRVALSAYCVAALACEPVSAGDGEQRGDGDAARLLAQRSEHAYTADPYHALRDEPEAVSQAEQQRLSELAHRRDRERRRRDWDEARTKIDHALDEFAATVNGDPPLHHALRAIRRSVEQVSRRLA